MYADAILAGELAVIHQRVGSFHELVDGLPPDHCSGADGDCHAQRPIFRVENRALHKAPRPLCDPQQLFLANIDDNTQKLLATPAPQQIKRPQAAEQCPRDEL